MKTTNTFDYPTAAASTYKAYQPKHQPQLPNNPKSHYQHVIKQESHAQRERAKLQHQKKLQNEKLQERNRIREEIQNKKRELDQLQRKRLQAYENQRKAAQFAKIKDQQDKITRYQNELKMKENQENASYRFKDALRRLQAEKQDNSYKERQALHRRKINQETQKQERSQAIRYKEYLQQREEEQRTKALQQQKKYELLYKQGLARYGVPKTHDFSKTCFHNPKMVYKYQEQQTDKTAVQRGAQESRNLKQKFLEKKQRQQINRQRSLQRGEKALERLSREKEYTGYSEQAKDQQIRYNLQRIQAGKKDQFVGLKPLTLSQMKLNKKMRSQQQFEGMFIPSTGDNANESVYANKYVIFQNKFVNRSAQNHHFKQQTHSDGNYQHSLEIIQPTTTFNQYLHDNSDLQPQTIKQTPKEHPSSYSPQKRNMIQTRATNPNLHPYPSKHPQNHHPHKEQLNYSQSQQQDSLN